MGEIIPFPINNGLCVACKMNKPLEEMKICEYCLDIALDTFNENLDDSLLGLSSLIPPKILERVLINKIFDIQNGKYN